MLFETSMMLLFVGILSFAVGEDLEYDNNALRSMLRTQVACSTKYQTYADKCALEFNKGIAICREEETAAKLALNEQAWKDWEELVSYSNNSCEQVLACGDKDGISIFSCLSEEGAKTSVELNDMNYKAKSMENDYNQQKNYIVADSTACFNTNMWLVSAKINGGIDELNHCMATGEWRLGDEIPDIPTPTAPEVLKSLVVP
ncbi:hypothetical protein EVAR_68847_1 [Eumeta japonica]|uniref:Protein TsetseEP domain-containing protein n=1 Tax=Eumeta variegata TaxID=151549 RepID=A0A4C1STE4_EUMVA|nr:hypothetical protein EVAR_68847_1 [Eumeta japonica]